MPLSLSSLLTTSSADELKPCSFFISLGFIIFELCNGSFFVVGFVPMVDDNEDEEEVDDDEEEEEAIEFVVGSLGSSLNGIGLVK